MLHIRLKELRGKIGMWALAMGWPELEAYGEPVNALRRRDVEDEALAAAEQEAWFSTKLWCVALASFHLLRKSPADKFLVERVFAGFLEATLPATKATEVLSLAPPDDVLQRCLQEPFREGQCRCLCGALSEARRAKSRGVFLDVVALILVLRRTWPCDTCQAWMALLAGIIAAAIDDNVEAWGDFTWVRTEAAMVQGCGSKRRRMDAHVKKYVVESAVKKLKASTPAAAVKQLESVPPSAAGRWVTEDMCQFRATLLLSFAEPGTVAVAFDMARLGKPAREYMMTLASMPRKEVHAVLAPQVGRVNIYDKSGGVFLGVLRYVKSVWF